MRFGSSEILIHDFRQNPEREFFIPPAKEKNAWIVPNFSDIRHLCIQRLHGHQVFDIKSFASRIDQKVSIDRDDDFIDVVQKNRTGGYLIK